MKTIYALLIGINEYNDPRNNLGGCVRDVQSIQAYFETHFNNQELTFVPLVLTDENATRANIIAGFDHFKNAKDGDTCLFHYSGHGSHCPSPKEFAHLDVNGKHQTLVCHDSRQPGGRDLLDKELSYLIWKTTKDKDLHFLAMMDCCHSGSNTRSDYTRMRRFSSEGKSMNLLKNYLGFDHYSVNAAGQYTPPVGHHVQLAAASAEETAKEVFFQGKSGGVFTYCLLELLKEVQNKISYRELINRIRIRIRNAVKEQSPQLDVTHPLYKNLSFLSNVPSVDFSYLVGFEKSKNSWVLDAGALHGITPPGQGGKTVLQLEDSETEIAVEAVFPHYAMVNNLDPLDRKKSYKTKIKNRPFKTILIAFAEANDPIGEKVMKESLKNYKPLHFKFSEHPKESQFIIHAKQDHYFLTKLDELVKPKKGEENISIHKIHSLFKKIKNYHSDSAMEFFLCMEKIAKWMHLLELVHPNTSIKSSEIKINFSTTLYHETKQDDVPVKAGDYDKEHTLSYELFDGRWCRPAFKLNIENTGNRKLWVSLLYLSSDFGVNNILISKQELDAGQNVSASYVVGGITRFIIPVQLEDHYLKNGIDSLQEYLKLFICTEEFETDHFNQKGVPFDAFLETGLRGLALGTVDKPDWATKEIGLKIQREEEPIIAELKPIKRGVKPGKKPSSDKKKSTIKEAIKKKPKPNDKKNQLPFSVNDYVECSVFAPKKASAGNDILIQAWLHLKEMAEEAAKRAKEVDEDASRRASKTLNVTIKKGDRLTLKLATRDDLEIDEPTQHLTWTDNPIQSLDFIVAIPEGYQKTKTFFVLHVFKQEIPIGTIKFFVGITTASTTTETGKAKTIVQQYKKAFISYASVNRNEVLKRVQMLAKLDIPFFQDVLDLNPGDNWEQELYKNIDACDVFFLFWSKAAKESKWVLKELQYAIERKKGDDDLPPFINPIPLEIPVVRPPKELGHLHFNDQILYFIVED